MRAMFDVEAILQSGGLLLVGLIIFAECGLLIGFFLPGDTLLFAAGFFAGQGKLPLGLLLATTIITSIVGYQTGYFIGEKAGPRVFNKKDGIWLRKEYADRTNAFMEKYGPVTILLARFIPVVRTFVSVIAGVGKMDKRTFLIYNILGGILWAGGVTLLGFWLGDVIPDIDKYLLPIVGLAILATFGASIFHIIRDEKIRKHMIASIKRRLMGH